jgi:hypothetical protein
MTRLLLVIVLALSPVGCAKQIHPTTVVATHASYDPKDTLGKPTSGILAPTVSGGRLVSLHVRDRYNSLIDSYGGEFQPPLKHDDGLTCDAKQCTFVRFYYIDYLLMVQWQRDGRPVKKKGFLQGIGL